MIGNEKYAAVLADFDFGRDDWDEPVAIPEGFTLLGCGAFRWAFLGPDNVVYKVDFDDSGMNEAEADMFKAWGDKLEMVRLAPCHLFDNYILAMEYIVPDGSIISAVAASALRVACRNLGMLDVYAHRRNWVTVKSQPVVIDYSM